jgi:hypothetical protein
MSTLPSFLSHLKFEHKRGPHLLLEYCWWWGELGNAFQLKLPSTPERKEEKKCGFGVHQ